METGKVACIYILSPTPFELNGHINPDILFLVYVLIIFTTVTKGVLTFDRIPTFADLLWFFLLWWSP
jgi:hypothetical protein